MIVEFSGSLVPLSTVSPSLFSFPGCWYLIETVPCVFAGLAVTVYTFPVSVYDALTRFII